MKKNIFKYLKTVFLWILIVGFITSTVSFLANINDYLTPARITKNPTDDSLIKYAKELEKNVTDLTDDLKDTYGDSYPALGISYYRTILHYSSEKVVQNFIFELIAGFGLGNIIYFIFIAKYKKYKLFIALTIALFVCAIFLGLSDILTNIANAEKIDFSLSNIFWNMEVTAIPYIIISLVLIGIQKVYSTYIEIRYS